MNKLYIEKKRYLHMAQTIPDASFGPFCFLAAVATSAAASCRCGGGSEVDEHRNEPKQHVETQMPKFWSQVS
jgi:hypothetical protein